MTRSNPSSPPRRQHPRGFTLVELLVVIGIIAILIGVLLPALSKAQQQARQVACMANMRSLGQAVAIYQSENKGAFPPSATTLISNHMNAPNLWWPFLKIPVSSNVRYCPEVAQLVPFHDLTPLNADGKPCYTTRSHVSYLYNALLGGFDTRNGPWHPTNDGGTPPTYFPCTYRSIPAASETLLFMDYPQLVVVCTAYESAGMDRGMVGLTAECSVSPANNCLFSINGATHQVFKMVAPVHFRKPAMGKGFVFLQASSGAQVRAMQGYINVCYCDGSVRSQAVRQVPPGVLTQGGLPANEIFKCDPATWDVGMGTMNSDGLPGGQTNIPETRYDPTQPP